MPCSTLLSDSGAHGPFRVKRVASQKGVFSDLLLTSDLVAKALRLDNSNIVDDALVEVEILRQPMDIVRRVGYLLAVVLLDQCARGSLDSLGSNTSHF
mgnify:CR=1 FL=1